MRKSEQICARITPAEMAILKVVADEQRMLLSEFVRQTLAEKVLILKQDNHEGLPSHLPFNSPILYRYK